MKHYNYSINIPNGSQLKKCDELFGRAPIVFEVLSFLSSFSVWMDCVSTCVIISLLFHCILDVIFINTLHLSHFVSYFPFIRISFRSISSFIRCLRHVETEIENWLYSWHSHVTFWTFLRFDFFITFSRSFIVFHAIANGNSCKHPAMLTAVRTKRTKKNTKIQEKSFQSDDFVIRGECVCCIEIEWVKTVRISTRNSSRKGKYFP